jgi:hypothetical protein
MEGFAMTMIFQFTRWKPQASCCRVGGATVLALLLCGAALPTSASTDGPTAEPEKKQPARTDHEEAQETKPDKTDQPEQEPDRYLAVKGAIVHTVSGPSLDGATVLAKNGKTTAIGHEVVIPDEARVLDASGLHLYPGLVAVNSSGLVGGSSPRDSSDVFGLSMTLGLAGGLTTVVSGNTAAKLSFGTLEDHVLKPNVFHTLQYSTQNPEGRRKFREALQRVRGHLRELEAYEEEKKTNPEAKEPDKAWLKGDYETALKLMRHELTAVVDADSAQQLRDVAALAEQYRLRVVVRGAREGWIVAPAMARAGLSAIITPRTRRDPDERLNRPNGSSIENARILYDHGVPVAVIPSSVGTATWGIAGRDLMHLPMEAAFAVRGGLPDAAAVRAITIDAARILGIDHRVGSIEVGKDADFAIVDGDLLHYMTTVRWTVVNGRVAYDRQQDSLLNHIRPGGDQDAPPPSDYWPRGLGDPLPAEPAQVQAETD